MQQMTTTVLIMHQTAMQDANVGGQGAGKLLRYTMNACSGR